jgi:hypothetical protein
MSPRDGDVAMGFKKMKYFSERRLMNSVFISKDSPILPSIDLIENNKVIFPTEPGDFYLGAVLFCKFITITRRYFHIDFMTIDSTVGDRVQYTLRDPSDCDLDLTGNYWWNMDTTYTGSGKDTAWTDTDLIDRPGLNLKVIEGGRVED